MQELSRNEHPILAWHILRIVAPGLRQQAGLTLCVAIVLDTQRARGEPEQDLSGEILIPSADETLTPPEILVVPSSLNPPSSTPVPASSGASSSSGVKRTYSESTSLPN